MCSRLSHLRIPLFAEILRPRAAALSIAGVGIAQLIAATFHFGFPCAFHDATGLPCPGCGLTRSCLALLHGHPREAFLLHPFGPPLLAALAVTLLAGLLPDSPRRRLACVVESAEVSAALAPLLFVVFLLLWTFRLSGLLPLAPV
jgi:hypothetical protein